MLATDILRILLASDPASRQVHHECGNCGTTVETRDADCPYCEDSRTITFDLLT